MNPTPLIPPKETMEGVGGGEGGGEGIGGEVLATIAGGGGGRMLQAVAGQEGGAGVADTAVLDVIGRAINAGFGLAAAIGESELRPMLLAAAAGVLFALRRLLARLGKG